MWLAILFWFLCSIGEATNPGPGKQVFPQIGCINPTGLLGKGSLIQQLPQSPDGTIWAVSETHLTTPGIVKMNRELILHKTGLSLHAGAPVPSRSNTLSAIGGRQRGVGFLTNAPHRAITPSWTKEQWYDNRIHSSCFLLANRWVQGGVVYGFSKQPDTLETKAKTEAQCQLLMERLVLHSSGLRFIAGDFNQPMGGIQAMQQLCDLGWVNIQQWALSKRNKPIQPTCKGSTTVDHVFVSPELALYLRDVHVDPTWFPDHSILWAEFESLGNPPMLPLWKQPLPIDWTSLNFSTEEDDKKAQLKHQPKDVGSVATENDHQAAESEVTGGPGTCQSDRCYSGSSVVSDIMHKDLGNATGVGNAWRNNASVATSSHDNTQKYYHLCRDLEDLADAASVKRHNKGLQKKQKGRAQVTEVTWVQEFSSPPKAGRHGDIAPQFHGIDAQHAKLLRQVRRLVNYVRIADLIDPMCPQATHRDQLWSSISNAKGFSPTFRQWWATQQHPYVKVLPWIPPTSVVASQIAKHVEAHLRQYEKVQLKHRVHKAKLRQLENPNVVFQDLKAQPPAPLQALIDVRKAWITEIDPDDFSIEVLPSQQWKDESVLINGQPKAIIHAEPDKLWLENIDDIHPNGTVQQETLVGDLPTLFERFSTEWKERWDRHLHTPNDFWTPIIEFALDQISPPAQQFQYEPVTYDQWMHEVRRKKATAAVGPDGISKTDLMNMPRSLVEGLLDMIHRIEQGEQWPRQAITGFVIALEKISGASQVSQFRPITIFSLTYRVWSSVRAKQLLQHLRQIAPETCMGNLPQKSAGHVWAGVQKTIELAQHHMGNMSGAVIDLIKAFNLLPRLPVLEVITHLGAPVPIVRAWSSSITQMERRFRLRNCVGPPVKSTTGFAEGDGLSVVAMLTINLICHQWIRVKHQQVTLWSYVDNIEVTSDSTTETLASLHSLQQVAQALDLLIDADKTYAWSIDTPGRQMIRAAEVKISFFARDLGGHMQYSAQSTNCTITKRISNMTLLWSRLARSLAPYGQKLRAIRTKGWTHCLHAISSAHVGDCHFKTLRTGVMQALAQTAMGASPMIHLSLVEAPLTDPQCHSIWQTVVDFRLHYDEDTASFVWQSLQSDNRLKAPPGPCSVVLTRLQSIAWEWVSGAWFLDHNRDWCNILRSPIQEIRWKILHGWQARVLNIAADRKSLGGLVPN